MWRWRLAGGSDDEIVSAHFYTKMTCFYGYLQDFRSKASGN